VGNPGNDTGEEAAKKALDEEISHYEKYSPHKI
jgi:hypothetical protein